MGASLPSSTAPAPPGPARCSPAAPRERLPLQHRTVALCHAPSSVGGPSQRGAPRSRYSNGCLIIPRRHPSGLNSAGGFPGGSAPRLLPARTPVEASQAPHSRPAGPRVTSGRGAHRSGGAGSLSSRLPPGRTSASPKISRQQPRKARLSGVQQRENEKGECAPSRQQPDKREDSATVVIGGQFAAKGNASEDYRH